MMRAFLAVDITREVLSRIGELVEELRPRLSGARWVANANLHLTVRFLGESDAQVLEGVSKEIDLVTKRFETFALHFRGVGFYPSPRRPRVLWVGVSEPPGRLGELHRAMEQVVRRFGFESEKRGFLPHLTLARFRSARQDRRFIDVVHEFEERDFGASAVQDVTLYRSILKPKGAEYHVVRRFPLQEKRGCGRGRD